MNKIGSDLLLFAVILKPKMTTGEQGECECMTTRLKGKNFLNLIKKPIMVTDSHLKIFLAGNHIANHQ